MKYSRQSTLAFNVNKPYYRSLIRGGSYVVDKFLCNSSTSFYRNSMIRKYETMFHYEFKFKVRKSKY
jgi:hypothetical protein